METKVKLQFGYNKGILPGVTTAWGARAIHDNYGVDIPPDRQCVEGPRATELCDALNTKFNRGKMNEKVKELVPRDYPGMPQGNYEYVLYEDDDLLVVANTQRSFGYLYIVAFFKDEIDYPESRQ